MQSLNLPTVRSTFRAIAPLVALFTFLTAAAQAQNYTRIGDLHEGQSVTVKARVGERVTNQEHPGTFVFTMRDDFGDLILAHAHKDISDIRFGATYVVSGLPVLDPATKKLYFEAEKWDMAYEEPLRGMVIVALVALILIIVFVVLRLRSVAPKDAWAYAEIVSGPDRGELIPLKGNRIVVGRGQDPDKGVSIVKDTHVSSTHGVLIRAKGQTVYEDSNSRNGSWIGEEKIVAGERVAVPLGTYLRLGPHTVIRIGNSPEADQTSQTTSYDFQLSQDGWSESDTGTVS